MVGFKIERAARCGVALLFWLRSGLGSRAPLNETVAQMQEVRTAGIEDVVLCKTQEGRPAALFALLGDRAGLLILERSNYPAVEIFWELAVRGQLLIQLRADITLASPVSRSLGDQRDDGVGA